MPSAAYPFGGANVHRAFAITPPDPWSGARRRGRTLSVSAKSPPLAQPSYRRVWSGDYNRDSGKSKGREGRARPAGRCSSRRHPVAASRLGVIQRLVRSADERVRSRAMLRKGCDTERNGDGAQIVAVVLQLQLGYSSADVLGALCGDLHRCFREEQRELLPPDAARDIALANVPLQQETHAPQDNVACAMAQAVVDALEVINIQSDYGQSVLLAVRARQLPQEEFLQKAAVVQTGERIADRLFMQGVANSQVSERKAGFLRHSRRKIQTRLYRIGIFRRRRFLFQESQMQQSERLALREDRYAKIGWDRLRIRRHVSTEQLGPRIPDPVSLRLAQGPAILDRERLLARRPVAPACDDLQMLSRRMHEIQLAIRPLE